MPVYLKYILKNLITQILTMTSCATDCWFDAWRQRDIDSTALKTNVRSCEIYGKPRLRRFDYSNLIPRQLVTQTLPAVGWRSSTSVAAVEVGLCTWCWLVQWCWRCWRGGAGADTTDPSDGARPSRSTSRPQSTTGSLRSDEMTSCPMGSNRYCSLGRNCWCLFVSDCLFYLARNCIVMFIR